LETTVKLFGVLERGRFWEKVFAIDEGRRVGNLAQGLVLPANHVDVLLVNGRHVHAERRLADGDLLSILPMVEGG
jgi:sulfur carrier protein ThiS